MEDAIIIIDYELDIAAVREKRSALRMAVCRALEMSQRPVMDLAAYDNVLVEDANMGAQQAPVNQPGATDS